MNPSGPDLFGRSIPLRTVRDLPRVVQLNRRESVAVARQCAICLDPMAANAPNEIEEAIKQLKSKPGFSSYLLMNNDGIVVKYENMEYKEAVMHAYHVLSLFSRTRKHLQKLFPDPSESEIEWLRLRTKLHEMVIAQHLRFTLVVLQKAEMAETLPEPIGGRAALDDTKEKEEEKPAAAT